MAKETITKFYCDICNAQLGKDGTRWAPKELHTPCVPIGQHHFAELRFSVRMYKGGVHHTSRTEEVLGYDICRPCLQKAIQALFDKWESEKE